MISPPSPPAPFPGACSRSPLSPTQAAADGVGYRPVGRCVGGREWRRTLGFGAPTTCTPYSLAPSAKRVIFRGWQRPAIRQLGPQTGVVIRRGARQELLGSAACRTLPRPVPARVLGPTRNRDGDKALTLYSPLARTGNRPGAEPESFSSSPKNGWISEPRGGSCIQYAEYSIQPLGVTV
jgi:hypothetical protein